MSPLRATDVDEVRQIAEQRFRELVRDNVISQEQKPRSLIENSIRANGKGTDGVLESRGNTAQWSTDANGLYLPKSVIDAKGDLVVGTADNTAARLAVGANGSSLVADSSKPTGVDWKVRPTRTRLTHGPCVLPNAAGDYVQAPGAGTAGTQFVPLGGNYPGTGFWTIGAMDLAMGSTSWRVRSYFLLSVGDPLPLYSAILGANPTGIYGITSLVNAGVGIYPENQDVENTPGAVPLNPRTVGGSGNRMYPFVGPWVTRAALIATGVSIFAVYYGRVSATVSVGGWGETGLEFELT